MLWQSCSVNDYAIIFVPLSSLAKICAYQDCIYSSHDMMDVAKANPSSFLLILPPGCIARTESVNSGSFANSPSTSRLKEQTPAIPLAKRKTVANPPLPSKSRLKRGPGRPLIRTSFDKENAKQVPVCKSCGFPEYPCPVHSHRITDTDAVPYAVATLPSCLYFVQADSSDLPESVCAKTAIPARTVFGPMRGTLCSHVKDQPAFFGVRDRLTGVKRFHTESLHGCNWMRFVRLARYSSEQNLTVYTSGEEIYFAATRRIEPDEEIKIWYSHDYARALGIAGRLPAQPMNNQPVKNVNESSTICDTDYLHLDSGLPDSLPIDEDSAEDMVIPASQLDTPCLAESDKFSNESTIRNQFDDGSADDLSTVIDAVITRNHGILQGPSLQVKRVPLALPKTVRRIRAVVDANPFQYPAGSKRIQAFESAVHTLSDNNLSETEVNAQRRSLQKLVVNCLDHFPHLVKRYDPECSDDVAHEYVTLMKKLVQMEQKQNRTEERALMPKHVNAESVKKLKAVVEINPFQFPVGPDRTDAWESAIRLYSGNSVDADEIECNTMRRIKYLVQKSLDTFPEILERYESESADDVLHEYVGIVRLLSVMSGVDPTKNRQKKTECALPSDCVENVYEPLTDASLPPALPIDLHETRTEYGEMELLDSDTRGSLDEGTAVDLRGTNSGFEQPERRRSKRTRDFHRFCYNDLRIIQRVEAVVQVNPYQYPSGGEREEAFDSALQRLPYHEPSATTKEQHLSRRALKALMQRCISEFSKAEKELVDDYRNPALRRYVDAVHALVELEKKKHRCQAKTAVDGLVAAAEQKSYLPMESADFFQSFSLPSTLDDNMQTDAANELSNGGNMDLSELPANPVPKTGYPGKRKRWMPRFWYTNPELIERVEAVVRVNPYQYPTGEQRNAAFDSVSEMLPNYDANMSEKNVQLSRRALKSLMQRCLAEYPRAKEKLKNGSTPILQRYVDAVTALFELEKNRGQKEPQVNKGGRAKMSKAMALKVQPITEGIHACTECNYYFDSEELLTLHYLGHDFSEEKNRDVEPVCPQCQETFENVTLLIAHVYEHRKIRCPRRQCPDCQLYVAEKFFDQHTATMHPVRAEGEGGETKAEYKCDVCRKEFATKKRFNAHEQKHRPKNCLYCAQLFDSWQALGRHVSEHKSPDGFHCQNCNKLFDTYTLLSRHYREMHDIAAVCICEICGVMKRNKTQLRNHMLNHSTELAHQCGLCGKRFKKHATLSYHRRWLHGTELKEKHKKKILDKNYQAPRKRMLYDEFKYKCEECQFGFVTEGRWLRHKDKFHSEM